MSTAPGVPVASAAEGDTSVGLRAPGRGPEDFLELVHRQRRGRLKVYLGYAAGVGKTYRMLEEAHALRARGVDVVVAFVETHGRTDTEALLQGLEVVPRRRIDYRGLTVEELDLDAVLARRPTLTIVDELPHTNAPGSRNLRRYEDVQTLLDAGIHVLCAMNVQHVESLHELVEKTTDVTVRETVPDAFLWEADQLVTVDVSIEDLLERLRSGKLYAPELVATAVRSFFRPRNLTSLRELTLREVADGVERAATLERTSDAAPLPALPWRVMVCIASASPRAASLLRRGARLAGRLHTDWYVVYVETPREAPARIDATAQRFLHGNVALGRELGATVVRLWGREPVTALLEFARSHRVGHLMLGRTEEGFWTRLFRRDVMSRLLARATDLDVHVVAFEERHVRTDHGPGEELPS